MDDMFPITFDVTDFTPPWVTDVINRLREDNEQLRERLLRATPHNHSEATESNPSGRCQRCALEAEFGQYQRPRTP